MSQVALPQSLEKDLPFTALAPMQDVTNLWFMKVISQYGSLITSLPSIFALMIPHGSTVAF